MPIRDSDDLDEQSTGLARAFGLIALVLFVGVVGYMTIGGEQYGIVDAIYMTMITLTTAGYGEVIDLSDSPEAGCSPRRFWCSASAASCTSFRT